MPDGKLVEIVGAQSLTLAFHEVFVIMAVIFVAALALAPFAKTVILRDAPPVAEH